MKEEFDAILGGLPDKPPRSRLEPYRELIEELRRRKRTYQEIADLLAEKCGVRVTGSTVHDFLKRRSGAAVVKAATKLKAVVTEPSVFDRIEALKAKKVESDRPAVLFVYHEDEPLTLRRREKETGTIRPNSQDVTAK